MRFIRGDRDECNWNFINSLGNCLPYHYCINGKRPHQKIQVKDLLETPHIDM
jgi:hypothetical protein